jgi:hypothetical protein
MRAILGLWSIIFLMSVLDGVAMAGNVPEGFDDDVIAKLESGIGSGWQDKFNEKWGDSWAEPCAAELAATLGSGWQSESADDKAAALIGMVAAPAEVTTDGDDVPDPAQDDWVETFADTNSFEEWLARIGVPEEEITGLAGGDTDDAVVPDPAQDDWVETFADTNSFEEWLARIGVPDDEVRSLAQS